MRSSNYKGRMLPVPFINGDDFKAFDHDRIEQCMEELLCSTCGKPNEGGSWWGIRSVNAPADTMQGLPMCGPCVGISLRACPHLQGKPTDVYEVDESWFTETEDAPMVGGSNLPIDQWITQVVRSDRFEQDGYTSI